MKKPDKWTYLVLELTPSTDRNELNSSERGPGSAVISCFQICEKTFRVMSKLWFQFFNSLVYFVCAKLHSIDTDTGFSSTREVGQCPVVIHIY